MRKIIKENDLPDSLNQYFIFWQIKTLKTIPDLYFVLSIKISFICC